MCPDDANQKQVVKKLPGKEVLAHDVYTTSPHCVFC